MQDNAKRRDEEFNDDLEQDYIEDETNEELDDVQGDVAQGDAGHVLSLRISQSLASKLKLTAREEGITVDELAGELLAEGIVVRAWEIIERKATMRGGNNPQNPNFVGGNRNNGNHAGGPQNKNNRRLQKQSRQHSNAMNLMQDKAAFLEYVRNQEKKRR
jgi:predicted DNA binding CopG/RHH family protein